MQRILPVLLRTSVLFLALVGVYLLSACAAPAPEIALIVTVKDDYTGQPVPNVALKLGEQSVTTDSSGQSRLPKWSVEESLQLQASGYVSTTVALASQPTLATPTPPEVAISLVLRPDTLTGTVNDVYTGKPLAGALVTTSVGMSATTDTNGRYSLAGLPESFTLSVRADDYASAEESVNRTTSLDIDVRPNTLSGTVVDRGSKKPIAGIAVNLGNLTATTDADGVYRLSDVPETGSVQFSGDGFDPITKTFKRETTLSAELRANLLKGRLVDAESGEPIDLKSDLRDDLGLVYYDSQVPLVKELEISYPYMDLPAILAEAKKRGIYTIARVHMFSHDNVLADARPEWAAKDRTTGEVFADYPGPGIRYAWLDPWNENVWDYNIALSLEAAKMGFDEINYDYIRFPSLEFDPEDKDRLQLSREESTPEERYENIAKVLERSQRAINGAGAFLSIDVFGYTVFRPDELIGQNISILSEHTDYIMPMVYPSHFSPGEFGMDNPARFPYEIITRSMSAGVEQVAEKRALLRPWLQDFTLTWVPDELIVTYGSREVRAQIQAVDDFSANAIEAGWVLYDSANTYTEAALKPE